MVIIVKANASKKEIDEILDFLVSSGLQTHISEGIEKTIIGVIGDKQGLHVEQLGAFQAVDKVVPIREPYKLANKSFHPEKSILKIKDVEVGASKLAMMLGPCAVESEKQIEICAEMAKKCGAKFLRGGAFKPRTSPYAFQGLELEGLKMMKAAADRNGLLVTSEIVSENDVEAAIEYVDIIQIGARNAQNFRLLQEVGRADAAVLLKRGISQTIEEWLASAEYIMSEGNDNVILCERGIRTFETATRNTLDISAIPVLKSKTHLPIIVDPSHAAGKRDYIESLSFAAIAAGADGLIIEMHPDPKSAVSDASQQLTPEQMMALCEKLKPIAGAVGREM